MNTKSVLMFSLAAAGMMPSAQAQLDLGVTADIRLGRAMPPPPPEVVVVEPGPPEPPPWEVTHWYRRSHDYYYYPGCDVYFRPSDRMWFYLEGGAWRAGVRLPDHVRVDFDRAVSLKLETDRPYLYHEKVVTYYPANYFSRVRFKHDRDNPRDRDDRDRADHGRGRDKDKRH